MQMGNYNTRGARNWNLRSLLSNVLVTSVFLFQPRDERYVVFLEKKWLSSKSWYVSTFVLIHIIYIPFVLPPNQGSTQLALPDMWFKLWDLCNGIHLHGTYQLLDPNSKPQPETAVPSLWMMLFLGMPRRPGTHRGVARCDLRLSLHHLVRRRDQGLSEVFEGGKGSWDPTGVSASVSRWNVGRFRPCWIWPGFILTGGCGLGLTKCLEKKHFWKWRFYPTKRRFFPTGQNDQFFTYLKNNDIV